MTELLRIEPTATAESVRRLVARLARQRLVIELPDGWTELNNGARMRLLLRQAQINRSELALITNDAATQQAATALGIPVFASSDSALRRNWQMQPDLPRIDPRRPQLGLPEPPPWRRNDVLQRTARPSHHQARQERIAQEERNRRPLPRWLGWLGYAAMASLMVAVLGGFVRYVLPAATITLKPGTETVAVTFALLADPALLAADMEKGELPARLVETTVEGSGTIATTGTQEKASLRATGQVVFSNLGNGSVFIPAGTIVSTGTGRLVQFRTTQNSGVEAGVGRRAFVPVEAVEVGIEANVRANAINSVDGALRFQVRVNNPAATGGGGAVLARSVTEQDMNTLRQQVRADIENGKDFQTLQQKLRPGEWLAEESILTQVISEGFDHYQDEQADDLNLTLRLAASGSAVDEALLRELLLSRVQGQLEGNAKLIANTLTVQRVPGAERVGSGVRFTVTVNAQYLAPIDPDEVRRVVAGLTEAEAIAILHQNWNLASEPAFYRDPEIFGELPALSNRIQVRVDYGE